MNKKNLKVKSVGEIFKENPWKVVTILLAGVLIILFTLESYKVNQEIKEEELNLCSIVEGTPAWADVAGNILAYGVLNKNVEFETNESMVDYLIGNNIKFIYSSHCGYCNQQIDIFGNDWEDYQRSGLTLNCFG